MDEIDEFVDERHKAWCIHCRGAISSLEVNRDHVPTKGLLRPPYPPKLPVVEVCMACNDSFSPDEAYLITFLGCVLAGSTAPEAQVLQNVRQMLIRDEELRRSIDRSRKTFTTMGGETRNVWQPEAPRVDRVLVKNARGHAYFEYGEPMLDEPDHIWSAPLETLSQEDRLTFERVDMGLGWPEVGSRMLTRVVTGQDLSDGWVIVQDKMYRYAVFQNGGVTVKTVIHEYLATEVTW